MKPTEILHNNNLKCTGCREGIISLLLDAGEALSETEIREKLTNKYNRTTFYRSFKTLLESKIIHKIVIDSQLVKYAIDKSVMSKKSHAHFYCMKCNTVKCLESIAFKPHNLPEGYTYSESEILIKGFCNNCKK